ncbi:MAG: EamA family transporter [Epsilonproteobacteria bacterium]|nr:EamA family transporter [Campylobacterota bacterium]
MFLIFILYFLYASIFIIGKFAIQISQPIFLTGMRMVSAGIISYILHILLYRNKPQFSLLNRLDWIVIVLLSFFNVYVTNAGEFWSLQYLSAGKTSFIYNLSPFFVLLFSSVLFSERITLKKTIGMVIGFVSLLPMLINNPEIIDTTYHIGWLSVAEIVMLCSAAATALGWVLMKHFIHKTLYSPYFLNGISMFIGGCLSLLHAFCFEQKPLILTDNAYDFLYYMLLMMFIQNVIAYNLHAYLLRYYSATLIALVSFVMPLMTLALSNALLAESVTYMFFICSAGVAIGLIIFYQDELKII